MKFYLSLVALTAFTLTIPAYGIEKRPAQENHVQEKQEPVTVSYRLKHAGIGLGKTIFFICEAVCAFGVCKVYYDNSDDLKKMIKRDTRGMYPPNRTTGVLEAATFAIGIPTFVYTLAKLGISTCGSFKKAGTRIKKDEREATPLSTAQKNLAE